MNMKAFRKAAAIGMLIGICATFFAGCETIRTEEEQQWVDEMNEIYEDDELTYLCDSGSGFMGGSARNEAVVRSKKMPDDYIVLQKKDGKLISNYNNHLYAKESDEYIAEYLEDYFDVDSIEVKYTPDEGKTELDDCSFKKYVKKYLHFDYVKVELIKRDGNFPSNDEMVEILTNIVKDRDEKCKMMVTCYKYKKTKNSDRGLRHYYLTMNGPHDIEFISVTEGDERGQTMLVENYTW